MHELVGHAGALVDHGHGGVKLGDGRGDADPQGATGAGVVCAQHAHFVASVDDALVEGVGVGAVGAADAPGLGAHAANSVNPAQATGVEVQANHVEGCDAAQQARATHAHDNHVAFDDGQAPDAGALQAFVEAFEVQAPFDLAGCCIQGVQAAIA